MYMGNSEDLGIPDVTLPDVIKTFQEHGTVKNLEKWMTKVNQYHTLHTGTNKEKTTMLDSPQRISINKLSALHFTHSSYFFYRPK